jgi:predicted dehydrogenase
MNPKPKAVLIGAGGKQGRKYFHLLKHDVIWVAVAERNLEAAQSISSYATKVVPSWQQLLSTVDFDVAVVAVPHYMHFEITKALLEAGRHVVKEKPFAIRFEDAQELAELARERGKSVYTIVQRQFAPEFYHCVTALETVGKPFWFNYQYHFNLDAPTQGWRGSPEMSHGGV